MQYLKLFHRLILRPLRQERLRTTLTVLAVALGIAAVLAIELAGEAATGSFRSSMETLTGSTDFEVTGAGGVPAEALARLARLPFAFKLHPRIEDYTVLADTERTVPLLGVDMLSESLPAGGSGNDVSASDAAIFQRDDSIWVGEGLGYKAGDRIAATDQRPAVGLHGARRAGRAIRRSDRDGSGASRSRRCAANGMLDRILIVDARRAVRSRNGRNCFEARFRKESRWPVKERARTRTGAC